MKIGVLMAVFIAVGSGFAGLIAHRQMSEMAHQAALAKGRGVLDALSIPAAVAIATHDYNKLDNFVAELERAQHGELLEILVVDHEGRLMATSNTGIVGARAENFDAEFMKKALRAKDVWFTFGPDPYMPLYLDIARPIYQGQRWGTLVARFSVSSLDEALSRLRRWTAAITALAALVGWAISFYLLSRVVITPTRQLAYMARKIGEGELEFRARIDRKDEIGELSNQLDAMADKLKSYTSGLEAAVKTRTAELESANKELAELATTDGLTGLRNHRFFRNSLEFEIKRGARRIHQLALCMIDIDHFKSYNDSQGHPAGDAALRRVGKLLLDNLRSTDLVARYGGEEFAVILLDTSPEEGFRTAQKLCVIFRESRFEGEELMPNKKLTISIGVASFPEEADSADQLIRNADLALYEAKRRGRNTVVRWTLEIPQHTGMTSEIVPALPPEEPA
jgi:diguanylate cyclase (GGDEF)-like protein